MKQLNEDNFIGKVCKCKKGLLGLVTHKVGNTWHGRSLDGSKPWQSTCPVIINEDEDEYDHNQHN